MNMDRTYGRMRGQVFALTWLTYASFYLARKSLAVVKVAVEEVPDAALNLTRQQFGYLDSIYLGAYALGQFVFGSLADRWGPRRVLMGGMVMIMVASAFLGFTTGIVLFGGLVILHGLGQASGWPGCLKAMSAWFAPRERGRVMGWWCTSYTVGSAVAAPFVAWSMVAFGFLGGGKIEAGQPYWPAGFWLPALVLGVFLMLLWFYLKNQPEDAGFKPVECWHEDAATSSRPSHPSKHGGRKRSKGFVSVLRRPAVWMLAFSCFSIKLTRYGFYFWGPKYINETLGSNTVHSAVTSAAMPIGGVFGVLLSGHLSDRWFQSRRVPITVISLVMAGVVLWAGQLVPIRSEWAMGFFFFLVGLFLYGPDALISATGAIDAGNREGAGMATGFVNGIGSIGAMVGALMPGLITTEQNWQPAFYLFVGGLVASALIILPMWKVRPKG